MTKLNYSSNTIGCNVNGEIFIHPELYKNPELYHAIVEHEKKHSLGLNSKDIAIDVFNDELKGEKVGFYKFMLTHPRTLLGYLPVTKIGKHWCFDLEITFAWAFLIGVSYLVGSTL